MEVWEIFEIYIAGRIANLGTPCNLIKGKANQLRHGDTDIGLEIKHDARFFETGNLYIETEERRRTSSSFVPSGIHSADTCWLYGIGGFHEFFVFTKERLRAAQRDYEVKQYNPTSIGFLLPRPRGLELANRHYIWPVPHDVNTVLTADMVNWNEP